MDYKKMDWESEANRVGWAFGFDYQFEFVTASDEPEGEDAAAASIPIYHLRLKDWLDEDDSLRAENGFQFAASYSKDEYRFSVIHPESGQRANASFLWQGGVKFECEFDERFRRAEAVKVLAHALFHLDLLTAEVEAMTEVIINPEERSEWAFEYEARHAYEKMDWPREAERLAMAFGIEGECEWSEADENTSRMLCLKDTNISSIQLTPTTYLWVHYCQVYRTFAITNRGASNLSLWQWSYPSKKNPQPVENWLQLFWDWEAGADLLYSTKDYLQPLRKALFHLDLLTPEIEKLIKVQLTAHERMEWTFEREAKHGF